MYDAVLTPCIGIPMDDLISLLDMEKIRKHMREDPVYAKYADRGPLEEGLKQDMLCLGFVLADADENHLVICDYDLDSDDYILYLPYTPGRKRGARPCSEQDAYAYLCQLLGRFTHDYVHLDQLFRRLHNQSA